MTVEGMGRTLDPDFDLMSMGRGLVKDLLKDQYNISNLSKDWIWIAKDLGTLLQVLPRQIRWMFKKFNNDGFAFEIISPQIENLREDLKSHSKKSSASILGAGLFIAGALSLQSTQTQDIWGYPLISLLLFGLGSVMFLKSLF
jgi:ubiquinone biosynthesis protein